jgi:hypothetical protein
MNNIKLTAITCKTSEVVQILQFVGETRVIVLLNDGTLQSFSIYDLRSVSEVYMTTNDCIMPLMPSTIFSK